MGLCDAGVFTLVLEMEDVSEMRLPKFLVCSCLGLALVLAGGADAQTTGTIQGFVSDDSGAALPGVTVTVENSKTGAVRTVFTGADGRYKALSLVSGVYHVQAALEGMQTTRQENVEVLVAQVLDINVQMALAGVEESIVVTAETPLVEVSRSSAASYVSEREIADLPILGRDFKDFALLTPTVQDDTIRGFIVMSGQRGIYSGLNIDGVSNKSAFFGYGTGGEATENDGLIVAQDSVKEFQIVTSSFAPEYGNNNGGYINVVTQSGTNQLLGSAFYFFRDDSGSEDIERSPFDKAAGRTDKIAVSEFERKNWGASVGGPIKKDRTHFFFSYDQTERTEPSSDTLSTKGAYDAILQLGFDQLVAGYVPNDDGVAAPDPDNGRTATLRFNRDVDNLILFGKIDHQFSDSHAGSFRINMTDYERISGLRDEESEKLTDTLSLVASLVSVMGGDKVNEARVQSLEDNLDRLSLRVGEPIEAQIRFRDRSNGRSRDSIGKFDFLPIFVTEEKLQFQDNFSYLFGDHDTKFGVEYQQDDLAQLFAGSLDGRYDFNSLEDFLNNKASNARIWFGDSTFPNYDETQTITALYAQDTWRPNNNLTISYGFRYSETDNPDGLPHVFGFAREIPDDDHVAPRFGFTWSPGDAGEDVLRGGVGIFYGRTPSLLFASQVQQPGIFPFLGRINVGPGDIGFVPLGTPIDNENPPAGAPNSPAYVDPSFEDAETTRFNLGYERQIKPNWSAGVDLVYAEGDNLQSNIELNRTVSFDEFGRPVYSSSRPNPLFNEVFTRQSIGESEYTAVTFKVNKRFSGRTQFQAHYTWSEDKDTDSNERSATGVTVSSAIPSADGTTLASADPRYDWGLSERDVENRLVVTGIVELPWGFKISGIAEFRDGRPFNLTDADADFVNCGFFSLGFNCPDARPVVNGKVVERNTGGNDSIEKLDVRVTKLFGFGDRYDVEIFFEVFNVFDEQVFEVDDGFNGDSERDPTAGTFGLADDRVTDQRQIQLGARFRF